MRAWPVGVVVGVTLVLAVGGCWSRPGDPGPAGPMPVTGGDGTGYNLLLITLDTTRADRVGAYGAADAHTPVLDELAETGWRVVDAVTTAPLTLPAHASILTGLYPPNHGARVNGHHVLGPSHETLAEVLARSGYRTAAFVSSFVLDARFGLAQGFGHYDDRVNPTPDDPSAGAYERSASEVTTAALGWLADHPSRDPYFLWVHYFDPHHAYAPPSAYAARFRNRPYDGEIAYVDAEVGRLRAALEGRGDTLRTIVVVAGDHGESLGEHGETFHGRTLYEGAMRVPLILSAPGLIESPGVVDGVVVSLVDIFPTVLDLLGRPAPRGPLDGASLLSMPDPSERMVYLETYLTYLDAGWAPLYAVRRHRDKYIEAPRPEYFDLQTDPGETRNRYPEAAASATPLTTHLEGLASAWPALQLAARDTPPIDEETRSRLLTLGYLSGLRVDMPSRLPDPKDVLPAHELLIEADALRAAGELEPALARVSAALAIFPRSPEALYRQGALYAALDRLREAEAALRQSLALREVTPSLTLLAQVLVKAGHLGEAADLLDRAAELRPDSGSVLIALGDLAAFRGERAKAADYYRHALRADPTRSEVPARSRLAAFEPEEKTGTTGPR